MAVGRRAGREIIAKTQRSSIILAFRNPPFQTLEGFMSGWQSNSLSLSSLPVIFPLSNILFTFTGAASTNHLQSKKGASHKPE